jgi:glutaredoxin 3
MIEILLPTPGGVMAKVVIYTKSRCPYCVAAKNLFTQKGIKFEEIFMDDKPEEYTRLKARTGMMTVPQIFINDELVGGYTELAALEQDRQLDPLLAK